MTDAPGHYTSGVALSETGPTTQGTSRVTKWRPPGTSSEKPGAGPDRDVEEQLGPVPALVLVGVDEERGAADLAEQQVVRPEQELAVTEAHRRAAVAAALRLEEHQLSVRGRQALDRRERGVGGDDPVRPRPHTS